MHICNCYLPMNILAELIESFPVLKQGLVSEIEIIEESDPLMLESDLTCFEILPHYLLWCVKHPEDNDLVSDGVLHAIAEYGRCKDPNNNYLNFKYCCNEQQRNTILNFLIWFAKNYLVYDKEQYKRTFRRWQIN